MSQETTALGPFLESLDRQVGSMAVEDLRRAVLAYGASLPTSKRAAFLAAVSQAVFPEAATEPLLSDIEDLLSRIRAGEFYEGWGWDDRVRAERAWGDVSWAEEMDLLFDEAGDAFVAGNMTLAREAYGRLLHAIWGGEEAEMLPGDEEDPTAQLDTDLGEAKARYLRALHEVTPPPDRAQTLLSELQGLWGGKDLSLQDLRDTRREELSDLDMFLNDWIALLQSDAAASFVAAHPELLGEAVLLQGGTDRLAALARQRGTEHPKLYLDLVSHLQADGLALDAIAVAQEALAAAVPAGEVRARIAERLAELASVQSQPALALDARREAWRACATTARLLDMCAAAQHTGDLNGVLRAESDLLPAPRGTGRFGVDERLACALLILAGQLDGAVGRLRKLDVNWEWGDSPAYLIVPCLLLAAVSGSVMEPGLDSVLCQCVEGMRPKHQWSSGAGLAGGREEPARRLAENLRQQALGTDATNGQRQAWISAAQTLVAEAAAAVVGKTRRESYDLVARLVVACAEALAVSTGNAGDFVEVMRTRYPRHVAFGRELDSASQASPHLPTASRR